VRRLAARERRHHEFGEPDRQRAHRRRGDRRAAAAAERDDAVDAILRREPGNEFCRRAPHQRDAFAAVAPREDRGVIRLFGRDGGRGDVGRDRRRAEAADVDQQGGETLTPERFSDEGVLRSLGVERSEDGDGGHE
jgi:hypothetical protein